MVVDYRELNEQTEHDSYSLPLIDSILQKQQKKRIFTVLHLKHGYHQMPLHEDSRPCTAMFTPLGPMQRKVVPIGAKNTYDFSSCFFPKFKKSVKSGFSRKMTTFYGFYGPKMGGGSSYPNVVQQYQKL